METKTLEQIGNDGKPTGHTNPFPEDVANRILARKKTHWREVKKESKKEAGTDSGSKTNK